MRGLSVLIMLMACEDKTEPITEEKEVLVDSDGDGFSTEEDWDDSNSQVNPGAEEICDGIDNNCDEQIDEDVGSVYYADSDQDGFGNPNISTTACETPDGFV